VTIRNLREANEALRPYVPMVKELTGKDTVLDRILPLMKALGDPQDRLKIIHIAGTSGKTSTAYYMAALLRAAGLKVGLTVSPHVDSVNERVQINGRPMAEADFCKELGAFLDLVTDSGIKPSYFELLYAFAIWTLDRQKVDYAVIETGMGGLHDATNVAARPDKVCILTDVDFDHMRVLGNTLAAIASQKVGIVHDHNHAFTYNQNEEIMEVFRDWAKKHKAPLHVVAEEQGDDLPAYQERNWNLAYQTYRYLEKRDDLQSLTSQVLLRTKRISIPGRMDIRLIGGRTVIMDGAHNDQKIKAFINSFHELYPDTKPAVLLALKTGKEYQKIVPLIDSLAARVIVTSFATTQDLPVESMDPRELAAAFPKATDVKAVPDSSAAFRELLSGPEKICVVTGSFYLLSQIRNNKNL